MEKASTFSSVDPLLYSKRLSYAKKKANDFEWAKRVADSIDFEGSPQGDKDYLNKRLENYALWNGHGTKSVTTDTGNIQSKDLSDEGFSPAYTKIQHYDVISQIGHGMHGEQIARELDVIAVDSSSFSQSEKRRMREDLVKQWLQQSIIAPMQEKIAMQVMQSQGVEDPYSLEPEQQMELQSMIDQQTEQLTPKDIKRYMSKDFYSTREKQANKLIKHLKKDLEIKFKADTNFQNAIIDGREIYRVGVRHGRPFLEIINPVYFRAYGGPDQMFIQDYERAVYERYIPISEVYNKYGDQLKASDLKKLDSLLNLHGAAQYGTSFSEHAESTIIGNPHFNDVKDAVKGLNIRTREGQRQIDDIKRRFSHIRTGLNLVREAHVVWKAQRRLKHIKRVNPETGEIQEFFVDESYKFNPFKGDLEQKDVWVNEVWEATKLGFLDAIYVDVRRVPFQYRSLNNPRDVKLPYIGAEYFKLMGNSEPTSPMEKGKRWNYDINLTMSKIREIEATDIGKVMLMVMNAKPDNWSWGKFFQVMRYTKIAPIDTKKEGIDAFDAQVFKSVDLSQAQDLASKIQYLEWLISRATISMSFNSARLGQTDKYSTVANNQQNLARSLAQTASIYQMHDKIVVQVMESLVNASRIAYKDNPQYFANILDDGEIAELELDPELLWTSELGIHLTSSGEDIDNLNMVKQNLMHFIQNGLGLPDSIRVLWSKSGAELYNIANEIEEKNAAAQQAQMEAMQQNAEMQKKMAEDMEVLKGNIKDALAEKEWAAKLKMADINADTLRRSVDVDGDNQNDYLQRQVVADELNLEKFEKEMEFSKEKFLKEIEIKEKELEIKEKALSRRGKK
jgi:hypothetical protein